MCIWNLFRETAKFGVDTYEEDSSFSSFATFEFHLIWDYSQPNSQGLQAMASDGNIRQIQLEIIGNKSQ